MPLTENRSYYIAAPSVVLRAEADPRGKAVNHLLFGDWLRYLGETEGEWVMVRCRGDRGWIRESELTEHRALEINFLDIGQGDSVHMVTPDDDIMLIDGGKTDNLFRFLNWRYNLRWRKVAGVAGVDENDPEARKPIVIDHVVISHPDMDHYLGFEHVFASRKLSVRNVYHNGIVERPISDAEKEAVKAEDGVRHYSGDDLGRYTPDGGSPVFVWDVVRSDAELKAMIEEHRSTTKKYLSTLREAVDNPANDDLRFIALSADDGHFPGFGENEEVAVELLGPVTEPVSFDGETRRCLRRLGAEGITKNGHSVVMRLSIGRLKVLLGGDLNTEAEDYLLRHYCDVTFDVSDLEKTAHHLHREGPHLTEDERQELEEAEARLQAVVASARRRFQVDVAKACHHGSHHFSETFLKALNSIAVVISSGDEENYAHPRPDALGAFGKYGRGGRPLLFSTEIARSTREFTPLMAYFDKLRAFEKDIEEAETDEERERITDAMENAKDRNVAVYGMITLRTDGETTIMAQKLEVPRSRGEKWDIHQLAFNDRRGEFEYLDKTKNH